MTASFHPRPPEADLLVVAAPFGLTGTEAGRAVPVDAEGLDGVLARHPARVSFRCPDRLGLGAQPLAITLGLARFRDLNPGHWIEQVPALVQMRAARQALLAGQGLEQIVAGLDPSRFGRLLEALAAAPTEDRTGRRPDAGPPSSGPPAAASMPAGDGLDGLFDLVEVPGSAAGSLPADPDRPVLAPLFSAVARAGRAESANAAPVSDGPLAALDALLVEQVCAVAEADAFQAFEAAWRGLRLLLDRLVRPRARRPRLRLALLDTQQVPAPQVLEAWMQAGQTETGPPLAVLVDGVGQGSAADLQAWGALAQIGESLQAPVISSAGPGLFERSDWAAVDALSDPETVLQGPAHQAWTALRDRPASRWLTLAANGVVLRASLDLQRGLGLGPDTQAAGGPLLGAPAWALGALLVESVAERGWPTELTADREVRLEGLDLAPCAAVRGGAEVLSPLQAILSVRGCSSLGNAGLAPLTGYANRDSVLLPRAASVHRPNRVPEDEDGRLGRMFSSLPYHLLLALVLRRLECWLSDPALPADRAEALRTALCDLVADSSGPGATVTVAADEAGGLDITLWTGRGVLGGVPVTLAL